LEAVTKLFAFSKSNGFGTRWGTGKETGSFTIVETKFFSKSIISCSTNGSIVLSFGGLKGNKPIENLRNDLADAAQNELDFSIPEDYIERYPTIPPSDWIQKVEILIDIVTNLIDKYKVSGKL
jgi:hypothetical protein